MRRERLFLLGVTPLPLHSRLWPTQVAADGHKFENGALGLDCREPSPLGLHACQETQTETHSLLACLPRKHGAGPAALRLLHVNTTGGGGGKATFLSSITNPRRRTHASFWIADAHHIRTAGSLEGARLIPFAFQGLAPVVFCEETHSRYM